VAGTLFRTKSIDRLLADAAASGEGTLKRTLGPVALVALGIGAIIGAGLFVRTAAAIADRAGPSGVGARMAPASSRSPASAAEFAR
jgi:APA family basic amino acid/polyamine antiporter